MGTRTVLALLVALSFGCRAQSGSSQPPAPVGSARLEQQVGWVNGSCMAIMDNALPADAAVTVVSLDEKSSIVDGRVVGTTASVEVCPPLLPDRRRSNSGWSFYQLRLSGKADLGIAVVGDVKRVNGGIDLNGDGMAERFTQCSTSEGVSFRVWSGPPYQGMPLWSGYYYLGYDTEANCPS